MTTWHGVTLDQRSADMMDEVARLCSGIIIDPTQGSYSGSVSASAGTHDGGGAIDIAATNLPQSHRDKIVYEMRRVGWAAWHRTPAQGFSHHLHGIAVQPGGKGDRGCLSSGAHDQVHDYFEGRNGLASNAPDDGPRDFVGATWETYLAGRQPDDPDEEGDMKPYAVNEGDRWVVSDLATYRTGVGNYLVIDSGLQLGVFALFNAGNPVSPVWVDFLRGLQET